MGFYGPILFHPIDVRLVAADRVKFSLNVLTRQLYIYIYIFSIYIESIASAYILGQVLFKRIALGMKYFRNKTKTMRLLRVPIFLLEIQTLIARQLIINRCKTHARFPFLFPATPKMSIPKINRLKAKLPMWNECVFYLVSWAAVRLVAPRYEHFPPDWTQSIFTVPGGSTR